MTWLVAGLPLSWIFCSRNTVKRIAVGENEMMFSSRVSSCLNIIKIIWALCKREHRGNRVAWWIFIGSMGESLKDASTKIGQGVKVVFGLEQKEGRESLPPLQLPSNTHQSGQLSRPPQLVAAAPTTLSEGIFTITELSWKSDSNISDFHP